MQTPVRPPLSGHTYAPDPDERAREALSGRFRERDTGKREPSRADVLEVMRQRHAHL